MKYNQQRDSPANALRFVRRGEAFRINSPRGKLIVLGVSPEDTADWFAQLLQLCSAFANYPGLRASARGFAPSMDLLMTEGDTGADADATTETLDADETALLTYGVRGTFAKTSEAAIQSDSSILVSLLQGQELCDALEFDMEVEGQEMTDGLELRLPQEEESNRGGNARGTYPVCPI
jgi:hypothetical protein